MIRPAVETDAGRIAALSHQLGYPTSTEEVVYRLGRFQHDSENAVFVAEKEGAAVGWIHVSLRHPLETTEYAEIVGLIVDEAVRDTGVGKQLVMEAEKWAEGKAETIRVRTNVQREATHRFYKHLGFSEIKKQTVFRKSLS